MIKYPLANHNGVPEELRNGDWLPLLNSLDIEQNPANGEPILTATGVAPGTYGDAFNVAQFTVDAKGRLFFAGNVPLAAASGTVSNVSFQDGDGFDGTVVTATTTPVISLKTTLTQGSVVFISPTKGITEDNALFFWDNTNKRLGLGNNAPIFRLHVSGTTHGHNVFSSTSQGGYANYFHNVATIPAGMSFGSGYTWAGGISVNRMLFAGSASPVHGAIIAGHTAANVIEFAAAGSTITIGQAAGLRAMAGFQILSQTAGANNGTVSHGASLFIQGVYPASAAVVTFTNYYGILINPLDEWGVVSFTNRWGLYQMSANDPNYFGGRVQIGNTSSQGLYNLQVTGGFYANVTGATMRFVGLPTDNTALQFLAKNTAGDNVWKDGTAIVAAPMRFGVAGEDALATANRFFDLSNRKLVIGRNALTTNGVLFQDGVFNAKFNDGGGYEGNLTTQPYSFYLNTEQTGVFYHRIQGYYDFMDINSVAVGNKTISINFNPSLTNSDARLDLTHTNAVGANTYGTQVKLRYDGLYLQATAAPAAGIYKGIQVKLTGDLLFDNYLNTRDDGGTVKALYVDATGNLKYGNVTMPSTAPLHNLLGPTHNDTVAGAPVLGAMIVGNATSAWDRLLGHTVAAKRFLTQTGTGVNSAIPVWDSISNADIAGDALSKVDDANVTLTLGGTPATALLRAVSLTLGWNSTLAVTRGGTALAAVAQGDILYGSAANVYSRLAKSGTANQFLKNSGTSNNPAWASVTLADVGVTAAALTKTDDTNITLTLGGSPNTALLAATSITVGWAGTLAPGRGGTGIATYALGDILYASATNVLSKLAGNITTGKLFLSQTGSGAVSAAPVWASMAGSDITGAALTKTDDTNVTLTLGGTPATALLRAASITVGWTGTLAVTRGGTGLAAIAQGDIIYGSAANTFSILNKDATATRYLSNTGTSNNPAWAQINLANGVTGTLPSANLGNGLARSVFGVTGNAAAARADIQSTAADQVLVANGAGTAIVWGTVATGGITNSAVTYAKIQNVSATSRFLGRITAGAGVVEELTGAQATALLDLFSTTTATKGVVPGSAGVGSTFFLRADGVWAVPPGSGGGGYTTLTQFVDETAWRIFYSNAAGDITPLAFGTSGQVLQSTGAASAPIWATAGGSGTIGGTIAATQVGYGSALNTLTSSADFIFVSGTLTLNKTTGNNIMLGTLTTLSTTTPVTINMGGSHSSVANGNHKLIVYDDGAGTTMSIGASIDGLEYRTVYSQHYHKFYATGAATWRFHIDGNQVAIADNMYLSTGWTSIGTKIVFYPTAGTGASGYNMGMDSATLFYNVPSAAAHRFRLEGVEAFSVGSAGTTTMTTVTNLANIGSLINLAVGQTGKAIEVRDSGATKIFTVDVDGAIESGWNPYKMRMGIDKSNRIISAIWFQEDNVSTATTTNFTLTRNSVYTTLNATGGAGGRLVFIKDNDGNQNCMVFTEEKKLAIGWNYNTAVADTPRMLNVRGGDNIIGLFPIARFERYTYPGTPNVGTAAAIEFAMSTQNAATNVEVTGGIASVITSTVAGAETFDMIFYTHIGGSAGAPTETFRSKSTGEIAVQTLVQDDALTKVAVWDDTSKLIKWRLASTIGGGGGITSLGPIGAAPNANAATITGSILNLEPASVAFGGVVTTIAQSWAGFKTFTQGFTSHNGDQQNFRAGTSAAPGLTTGSYNTLIGYISGSALTTQSENTVVGAYSAHLMTGTGNTGLGIAVMQSLTGHYNVALGNRTMGSATGALTENIAIGSSAMINAVGTATHNIVMGYFVAQQLAGSSNILLGFGVAGQTTTTATSNNVIIGYESARLGTVLANNVIIGYQAGYSASTSYSVFLGYQAGYNDPLNYRLSIETTGATPLIEGSFAATRYVRINNAYLSVPGTGGNSERFGWLANAGENGVAVGPNAQNGGYGVTIGVNASGGGVAIGYQASATLGHVAIGGAASASQYYSMAIGNQANSSGYGSIAIGDNANGTGISIGYQATSAGGQFVAGCHFAIGEVYFGNGVVHATPAAYALFGSSGLGTDIAGANIGMNGGRGTGAGIPGDIIFKTSTPLASGTTLQTLSTKLTVGQYGIQPYMNYWTVQPAGTAGYMQYNSYNNIMYHHDGTTWRYLLTGGNGPSGLQSTFSASNGLKMYYDGSYYFRWNVLLGDAYSWSGEPNLGSSLLGSSRYIPLNGFTLSFVKGVTEDPGYANFVNHGMTIGHSVYIPDVTILRVGAFAGVTKSGWWNPIGATGPGTLAHFYSPPMTYGNAGYPYYSVVTIENDNGPDPTGTNLSGAAAQTALSVLLRINAADGTQTPQEWIAMRIASISVTGGGGGGGLLLSRMYAIKATAGRIYSQDGFHYGSKTADEVELALAGYMTFRSDTGKFRVHNGTGWRNLAYEGALVTPWRVFYSDGTGAMTELPIGASGLVLTSNGAAAAPSWVAPPGAGGGGTPGLPDTSVQYNAAGSFAGSAQMTFASGLLTLGKTTGKNLQLGVATSPGVSSASPSYISLGNTYSSVNGTNLKLLLYEDATLIHGFGVSAGQMDYVIGGSPSSYHSFYTNGFKSFITGEISSGFYTNVNIETGKKLIFNNGIGEKIAFYTASGAWDAYNMGIDTYTLWYNVPTSGQHSFRQNGVVGFSVGNGGYAAYITPFTAASDTVLIQLLASQVGTALQVKSATAVTLASISATGIGYLTGLGINRTATKALDVLGGSGILATGQTSYDTLNRGATLTIVSNSTFGTDGFITARFTAAVNGVAGASSNIDYYVTYGAQADVKAAVSSGVRIHNDTYMAVAGDNTTVAQGAQLRLYTGTVTATTVPMLFAWFTGGQTGNDNDVKMLLDEVGGLALGGTIVRAHASSLLDVHSSTRGFLAPRMTTAQKNAIVTPAIGLWVYDTDLATFYWHNGSAWTTFTGGAGGSTKFGKAGEDATAAENRAFALGTFNYSITTTTATSNNIFFSLQDVTGMHTEMRQSTSRWWVDSYTDETSTNKEAYLEVSAVSGNPAVYIFANDAAAGLCTQMRIQPNGIIVEYLGSTITTVDYIFKGMVENVGTKTLRYNPATGDVTYHDIPTGGAGTGFATADNGLTASTATNVQLFGPTGSPATLLNSRALTAGAFSLAITGTANNILTITNTDAGNMGGLSVATNGGGAIIATSTSNTAVSGQSGSGSGGSFRSTGSTAVDALSFATNQPAIYALNGSSGAGTVRPGLWVARAVTSAAATDNTGVSIDFYVESSDEQMYITNQIVSKWTTVNLATRRSSLTITGVNAGLTADLFTLSGLGATRYHKYGVGSFLGVPVYSLGVDASGNMVEFVPATGGGTIGGSIVANQVAYGTGSNTIAGSANFTWDGQRVTVAASQSWPSYVTGTLYLQSYSLSNSWISENAFHNAAGGGWFNTATGAGGVLQFGAGEVAFRLFPSQPAGTMLTSYMIVSQLKLDATGAFGIGGAIVSTSGVYTGAHLYSDATGNITLNTVAQDDAQTRVMVWDSATKVIKWRAASTLGGTASTALSSLTAATAFGGMDNANFGQTWQWTTLGSVLGGNTTALLLHGMGAAVKGTNVLQVTRSGSSTAGFSHTAINVQITATGGNNIGVVISATGGVTNNALQILAGDIYVESIAQNDAIAKLLTWDSGDKIIKWRDAATLMGAAARGFTTTATTGGTTTLTVSSTYYQYFTGTLSQFVVMPVVGTLALGQEWEVVNLSTDIVYVRSSGGIDIIQLAPGTSAIVTCQLLTGTNNGSWYYKYNAALISSSVKLIANSNITFNGTGTVQWTLPGSTNDTLVSQTATQTLTNKRITARVGTVATSSSLTIDSNVYDLYTVTALAGTMVMNNPSGAPTEGQKLMIRITDNGTIRTLTWSGSQWRVGDIALPVATFPFRTMYLGFVWNSGVSKWDFIAYNDNFV